jgi:hypothetical protein
MEVKEIWKLPVPSTALLGSGATLEKRLGRAIALRYEIEGESGESRTESIVFDGVESFRCTYGPACAESMLAAYDRLVELPGSSWVQELGAQLLRTGGARPTLRHLMIYFDDGPCYEVVCRSFHIEQ